MNQLHPDWPESTDNDPYWDFRMAFDYIEQGPKIDVEDVARIERYHVTSEDGTWQPGGSVGPEMSLYIVGVLKDGRWFSIEGGCDYTGWDCRGGSETYIGDTEQDVVDNGVTKEGRAHLGYESVTP